MTDPALTIDTTGVTGPRGFLAGAAAAGIRTRAGLDDLALLYSETTCAVAGVFTSVAFRSAPVELTEKRVATGRAQAVIVNAGCANAYTGDEGYRDAEEMASLAASHLRLAEGDVLVASTGVTGGRLPMDKLRAALPSIELSADGGERFAYAILTTDTVAKQAGASFSVDGREYRVGGCAKGSGMIAPNLATMLAFLTTDAPVEPAFLQETLQRAAETSFNMIVVDGDTSPNDTLLLLANGAAGGPTLREGVDGAALFTEAVELVCVELAKGLARDGEGATKLIEVRVTGATSVADARAVGRTVVESPLLKSAVYGDDPNWGRVIAAVARSGAQVDIDKLSLTWQGVRLFENGAPQPFDKKALSKATKVADVRLRIDLGLGEGRAVAWGCDLTEEYVRINSEYTT
jgi:glutamate N-acetyltransferase/amino-acid N-acetyltransferase